MDQSIGGGSSRDRLLQQLASLDARSVTAIFDACFTGTGKEGKALFEGGKNIGLTARPREVSGISYAWHVNF